MNIYGLDKKLIVIKKCLSRLTKELEKTNDRKKRRRLMFHINNLKEKKDKLLYQLNDLRRLRKHG